MDTWLLEFRLKNGAVSKHGQEIIASCGEMILKIIDKSSELVYKYVQDDGLKALWNSSQSNLTILLHSNGDLLTCNINWPKINDKNFRNTIRTFDNEIRCIELYQKPRTAEYAFLPPIKRGREFSLYDEFANLIVERNFDELVYDEVSPYQSIRILHSIDYGNMLYLDNIENIAESDIEYTRAMTGFDLENYKDKTVLILGGGDGGILHYIRDLGPKMITMIEIDQMVIDAAKVHLRGICHDALDQLTGKNYEIIVDDCVKYLKKYIKEGRKFDYVINDLTDIPVHEVCQDDDATENLSQNSNQAEEDFASAVISMGLQVLDSSGKYFGYGSLGADAEGTKMFEDFLKNLKFSLEFQKKAVSIPSYCEIWWFYRIWKT